MKDLTYQIIKNGLDASAKRQRVISSNIANVNTSGYKASTVKFETELQKAIEKKGSLVNTHEKHLGAAEASEVTGLVERSQGSSMNENGNNVDIDREMVDLAANEIYYNALIEQVNRKLSSMSYVINR
ncbi:flagellar basal body rod protein FlgB [Proteiniclasticum ruminis]|uniref:Flagellar basal body rod protein FlgB n=1 Tax=Proteiniclasticum ruminis TaxID=398199 RepID=A0A1G8I010_9CLOT|nr:flagellar basal body rod protein FlgB [Proteiniclasticum ruminis]SDI12223.1 flagellar basal-body rod protein FlgB [Proteiniclasticum ruminis]